MRLEELRYRRQFIMSHTVIPSLSFWKCLSIRDEVYVYYHSDLECTYKEYHGIKIVLLGYLFDAVDCDKTNEDIVSDIASKTISFESFVRVLKSICPFME